MTEQQPDQVDSQQSHESTHDSSQSSDNGASLLRNAFWCVWPRALHASSMP